MKYISWHDIHLYRILIVKLFVRWSRKELLSLYKFVKIKTLEIVYHATCQTNSRKSASNSKALKWTRSYCSAKRIGTSDTTHHFHAFVSHYSVLCILKIGNHQQSVNIYNCFLLRVSHNKKFHGQNVGSDVGVYRDFCVHRDVLDTGQWGMGKHWDDKWSMQEIVFIFQLNFDVEYMSCAKLLGFCFMCFGVSYWIYGNLSFVSSTKRMVVIANQG